MINMHLYYKNNEKYVGVQNLNFRIDILASWNWLYFTLRDSNMWANKNMQVLDVLITVMNIKQK